MHFVHKFKPDSSGYYPAMFQFLGYDPFARGGTLGDCLAAKRGELGLTVAAAAKRAGVNEGTFRRWERGEWTPRLAGEKVEAFLAIAATWPNQPSSTAREFDNIGGLTGSLQTKTWVARRSRAP